MAFKALREKQGFPRASDLARATGLHQTTISLFDLGKNPNPTIVTLEALAKALGVSVDTVYRAIRRSVRQAERQAA